MTGAREKKTRNRCSPRAPSCAVKSGLISHRTAQKRDREGGGYSGGEGETKGVGKRGVRRRAGELTSAASAFCKRDFPHGKKKGGTYNLRGASQPRGSKRGENVRRMLLSRDNSYR